MTQEQDDAKNWRILKQRNLARERLTRLESEFREFVASWRKISVDCADLNGRTFRFDEEKLTVFNSRDECLAVVPWLHFTREKIEDLVADIQTYKDELEAANADLRKLGVE